MERPNIIEHMAESRAIFLVDDEVAFTDMMSALLEAGLGLPVRVFNHPGAAIEALEHETPLFLISDLAMPEIDGFELLHFLHQRHPTVRCLLVTGNYLEPATVADRRPPNMVDVLFKPLSWRDIASKIREYTVAA